MWRLSSDPKGESALIMDGVEPRGLGPAWAAAAVLDWGTLMGLFLPSVSSFLVTVSEWPRRLEKALLARGLLERRRLMAMSPAGVLLLPAGRPSVEGWSVAGPPDVLCWTPP